MLGGLPSCSAFAMTASASHHVNRAQGPVWVAHSDWPGMPTSSIRRPRDPLAGIASHREQTPTRSVLSKPHIMDQAPSIAFATHGLLCNQDMQSLAWLLCGNPIRPPCGSRTSMMVGATSLFEPRYRMFRSLHNARHERRVSTPEKPRILSEDLSRPQTHHASLDESVRYISQSYTNSRGPRKNAWPQYSHSRNGLCGQNLCA